MSDCWVPAQRVDATQALNLSAGVSNCKVSRAETPLLRGDYNKASVTSLAACDVETPH
jgi:hypothetical protein